MAKPDANKLIRTGHRIKSGDASIDADAWLADARAALDSGELHEASARVIKDLVASIEDHDRDLPVDQLSVA
ncbi:MAG TPA: hypothetical protein VD998_00185 [Verrucomicrobiae bacterium]|nr:hypothetical protein [Verrucomicrobiae bacterium]